MTKRKSPFFPVRALIFDMDGTLYRSNALNRHYAQSMYDFLAAQKGISSQAAKQLFLKTYCHLNQKLRRLPSKLFTLKYLGVSDTEWSKKHGARVAPEKYIKTDQRLRKALRCLRESFRMAVVTNNHAKNMQVTLDALGVADLFDKVLSLTDTKIYKPSSKLYTNMASALQVEPEMCLSIGDRYDLDLAPAAEIGMQTVLVQKMQDIYVLPEYLRPQPAAKYSPKTSAQAQEAITAASRSLKARQLVVLPTDTVYGIASVLDSEAITWIYRAKGRVDTNPLPVLLSSTQQAEKYAEVSPTALALMKKYWPGGLTIVLPVRRGTAWGKITRSGKTIALRVPDHIWSREVIKKAGGAVAATSANCSGEPPPRVSAKINKKILAFSNILLDAGTCKQGIHSTIVKVSGRKMDVLRQGGVNLEL
ncbi:threonylcarbamoyl-AMP synthase [bacterium]|nr:threonylcarbamoyl-AMP synthase [bacterium]